MNKLTLLSVLLVTPMATASTPFWKPEGINVKAPTWKTDYYNDLLNIESISLHVEQIPKEHYYGDTVLSMDISCNNTHKFNFNALNPYPVYSSVEDTQLITVDGQDIKLESVRFRPVSKAGQKFVIEHFKKQKTVNINGYSYPATGFTKAYTDAIKICNKELQVKNKNNQRRRNAL
ncbi:hypothetical protein VHA01S_029_00350 [Vibrio halioticoli NBRC 102217]|uniref:Uncharacterized protein n=1 Tax=Vibrio halioticoli NBRC 102217 TaxID=1219072 RepID=V5FM21_9VIBR|nr:hypothetical protein [Vibrio halioticoli]GAD89902.1 hypothetical protein VHA01S_029_00350 [Vibrio halioticoli NBRC 102217]